MKKSFFQKVLVKETCLTNHVVLLVSNITPSMNTHSKSVIVELSDGAYSLPCLVSGDRPPDGKEERFDCDAVLMKMIHSGCLQVGDKVRCFGLYMFFIKMQGHDAWEQLKTDHYFLSQQYHHHLKINVNGFQKANRNARLGE